MDLLHARTPFRYAHPLVGVAVFYAWAAAFLIYVTRFSLYVFPGLESRPQGLSGSYLIWALCLIAIEQSRPPRTLKWLEKTMESVAGALTVAQPDAGDRSVPREHEGVTDLRRQLALSSGKTLALAGIPLLFCVGGILMTNGALTYLYHIDPYLLTGAGALLIGGSLFALSLFGYRVCLKIF